MCETDAPNGTNGQEAPNVRILTIQLPIAECCTYSLSTRPRRLRDTTHTRLSRTTSPMSANSRLLSQPSEVSMLLRVLQSELLLNHANRGRAVRQCLLHDRHQDQDVRHCPFRSHDSNPSSISRRQLANIVFLVDSAKGMCGPTMPL